VLVFGSLHDGRHITTSLLYQTGMTADCGPAVELATVTLDQSLLPISVFVKHNLHISCLTGSKLKKQLSVFFAFRLETNFVIFLAADERFNFADAVS